MNFSQLQKLVGQDCAAARVVAKWHSAGGSGSKVFPSTYSGGVYATETRLLADKKGELAETPCVLVSSTQAEANSMELALQDAFDEGLLKFPVLSVEFPTDLVELGRVTTLDAPHRLADAIFRDSLVNGVSFRDSDIGKAFESATIRNATAMYELCPHALVMGTWDSTGSRGGLGNKFARVLTSELIGINFRAGVKTGSRIDPLQIERCELYEAKSGGWTIDVKKAKMDKKVPVLFGKGDKKGKPSAINHGNVTPDLVTNDRNEIVSGGVTVDHVQQTTVLSFAGLRRLRFPDASGRQTPERNQAARTVLAALAFVAITQRNSSGLFLRSGCSLVCEKPGCEIEFVKSVSDIETIEVSGDDALKLFSEATEAAEKVGLTWRTDLNDQPFTPIDSLIELVRHSRKQNLAETETA